MNTQTITRKERRAHPAISMLGILTLVYAVGYLGAVAFNFGAPSWYLLIRKPEWALPMGLFVPIWTLLYAMIGIAAWVVYQAPAISELSVDEDLPSEAILGQPATIQNISEGATIARRTRALAIFALVLILLTVWPYLFFYWHTLSAASASMVALIATVAVCMWAFARVSRVASLMMVPFMAWCVYALLLSLEVAKLNPPHIAI